MTSYNLDFTDEGQEESPSYPTAFGITFTPQISGILLAVVGIAGAAYMYVTFVQPLWQEYNNSKAELVDKQQQLQNTANIKKQIAQKKVELEQAKVQNKTVLSLFATDRKIDTLLLDINSAIKTRQGKLTSFKPAENPQAQGADTGGVINDGSLGSLVNGKLKRKTFEVELDGNFDQLLSIMRQLELLQTLLLIKDFKTEVKNPQVIGIRDDGKVITGVIDDEKKSDKPQIIPGGKPKLKTTFKIDALLPVTQEESKTAAAAQQPAK